MAGRAGYGDFTGAAPWSPRTDGRSFPSSLGDFARVVIAIAGKKNRGPAKFPRANTESLKAGYLRFESDSGVRADAANPAVKFSLEAIGNNW
jgi:hypothetical protein